MRVHNPNLRIFISKKNSMLEVIARESGDLDAAAVKSLQRIRKGRKKIRAEVDEEDQQLTEDVEDRERELRYKEEDVERLEEKLGLLEQFKVGDDRAL